MGLMVNVYRNGPNVCPLNKIQVDRVCIVNVDGPFEPREDCPAVELRAGSLVGIARIVPVETDGRHPMFGGAYVATSDSRFNAAVERIVGARFYGAVPLHDRFE